MEIGTDMNVIKKIFYRNRTISLLYITGFIVLFLIIFYTEYKIESYSLSLKLHDDELYSHYVGSIMDIDSSFVVDENTVDKIKAPGFSKGIFALLYSTEASVETAVMSPVLVIMEQNEALNEKLQTGAFPTKEEMGEYPCAVIGEGLLSVTYEKGGKRFWKYNGEEVLITGVFRPNMPDKRDVRIITYWDSLSIKCKINMLKDMSMLIARYWTDEEIENEEVRQKILDWLHISAEGKVSKEYFIYGEYCAADNRFDTDSFYEYTIMNGMYVRFGRFLMCLEIIYCLIFSFFWGRMHTYEYMVKKAFGMGNVKIYIEMIFELAVLVAVAFMFAMMMSMIYLLLADKSNLFLMTIKDLVMHKLTYGIGLLAVLGAVPLVWVMKKNPGEYLKTLGE